ncbi:MAG: hypothetical protein ACRD68_18130, partial [Pyrinomonadaceae bacterium]
VQKFMLYGLPLTLLFSGFFFPIGVVLYQVVNNLFSMGQQFWVIKKMPHDDVKPQEVSAEQAKALAPKPGVKPGRDRLASPQGGGGDSPHVRSNGKAGSTKHGVVTAAKKAAVQADREADREGSGEKSGGVNGKSKSKRPKSRRKGGRI